MYKSKYINVFAPGGLKNAMKKLVWNLYWKIELWKLRITLTPNWEVICLLSFCFSLIVSKHLIILFQYI